MTSTSISPSDSSDPKPPCWLRCAPVICAVLLTVVNLCLIYYFTDDSDKDGSILDEFKEPASIVLASSGLSFAAGLILGFALQLNAVLRDQRSEVRKATERLASKERECTFSRNMAELDDMRPYGSLLQVHVSLMEMKSVFTEAMKEKLKRMPESGVVLDRAGTALYLRFLRFALETAQISFKTVIRDPFYPWWFFNPGGGMPIADKQDWIKRVARATRFSTGKTRLMIYEWFDNNGSDTEFRRDFWANIDAVEEFLGLNGNVALWLLDHHTVRDKNMTELLNELRKFGETREEFAVFDDSLVVRYVIDRSVHVIPVTCNSIDQYRNIFKLFDQTCNDYWIPFNDDYIQKCRDKKRLLSREEL